MGTLRGRIKPGTMCGQDFKFFRWPDLYSGARAPGFGVDILFNIEINNGRVFCWADGYGGGVSGRPGAYGCGAILLCPSQEIEG